MENELLIQFLFEKFAIFFCHCKVDTKDILYTMDINCFEKSFRDVDVSINEVNSNFDDSADWQDPNGDKLILGVIGQVCRVEN